MKNVLQRLACLVIPFMLVGCTVTPADSSNESDVSQASSAKSENSSSPASVAPSSTSSVHQHKWGSTWVYDQENHWQECQDRNCDEKNGLAKHEFGDPVAVDPGTLSGADRYAYTTPKVKKCKTCSYYELVEGTNLLPELRFNFTEEDNPGEMDFASKAKKNDVTRPEVKGTFTLSNCPEGFEITADDKCTGTMKVRGNQTAGWRKKAFRIKFDKKRSMMGLNGGGKFKKWVLLADAKDTTLIRSAIGLYLSREICKTEEQIWVCDYTPVTVYLNDEYWGYYYLGEQKEVKPDKDIQRVRLPEVEDNYTGVDIGYCFELDYYADGKNGDASEKAKGADGDPTFRVKYSPRMEQGRPSGPLAAGQIDTYTMLSDITDGPADAHVEAEYKNNTKTSNSNQLTFIRDRIEKLYTVLYNAAISKKAKEINEAGELIDSNKTIEEVMRQHFDIDAWVDGFIINAFSCPPDLGYSSFYMAYDNSPNGDHRLRYDCPWDFDSNFGNRNNFITNADQLYVDNTYNTWIYLLSKLDFFISAVKDKWNELRDTQVFEGMFKLMRKYFADYDLEIHRNHYRWPENDAASMVYNNFDEIREPFKDPAKYKDAEEETISWCAKRVNYLERQWGKWRPNINTNPA